MIRRRRILAAGCLVACVSAAAGASGASAETLELTGPGGTLVARGAGAVNELITSSSAGSCLEESVGTVSRNGHETDRLSFPTPPDVECVGESASGGVSVVRLTNAGVMTLRMNPKLMIAMPGPCVYRFNKLEGTFNLPGIAYATGQATGKRDRQASSASCAKTTTIEFAAGEFGPEAAYVFSTELIA